MIGYGYDALGRMSEKDIPGGTAADVYYGYDARGHQTWARFGSASGQGVTNAWDGFGALTSATTNMGGTTRTLSYQYDRDGDRTVISHPDGAYFAYTYDGLDRPQWLWENGVDYRVLATWLATGVPGAQFQANGGGHYYGYDEIGRLNTDVLAFAASPSVSTTFTRNAAGQIASTWRDNDAYAWTGHYAVQRAYTTNGLNQYSAAGSAGFTYDTNGNLITDGANTYTYDMENRLIAATGAHAATLAYDPLGRLFSVTSAGVTTQFLYDGDAMVAEYDAAGTLTRRYVHGEGADVPLVQYNGTDPNQIRFLYADQQGSIVAASDGAGTMTAIDTYDEYGIPGASNTGRFQYTGQAWLAEIGMYYYKARIYSPTLGRFLQTDPIGYADQYNLYEYVGDDPVNGRDPTGLYKCRGPQCAAFEAAFRHAEAALRRTNLTASQRQQLRSSLRTLGQPGSDNGINVSFVSQEQIYRATGFPTAMSYTTPGPNNTISIHVTSDFATLYDSYPRGISLGRDYRRLSAQDERAAIAVHEGVHAGQFRGGLTLQEYNRNKARYEDPAYRTGRIVNRAFGSVPADESPHVSQ